jgi:ABC-type Na+ efflux pump permease subunit
MRWWNRWWPFWGSYYYPLTSPSYVAATIGPEIAAQAKAQEKARAVADISKLKLEIRATQENALESIQQKEKIITFLLIVSFVLFLIVFYFTMSSLLKK